ncbi:hypothetical protein [Acerihabitans arboris]|uniref:Uncharacterized protein n=1 Tax=Acerihabitans arboris TaxID=2691583 RepID=A0A845SAC4_9GAMM|nr:hypothetical protein [Acerihabitans arboris]NDL61733.1 hypothetical protein [Acerihabitans arboris]
MTEHAKKRLALLGALSQGHQDAVLPTLEDWVARADALSRFVNQHLDATVLPITVRVSPLQPINPRRG